MYLSWDQAHNLHFMYLIYTATVIKFIRECASSNVLSQVNNAETDQEITFIIEQDEEVFGEQEKKLILRKPLDYETQSVYNLTIIAQDNGSPSAKVSPCFILELLENNSHLDQFYLDMMKSYYFRKLFFNCRFQNHFKLMSLM